MSQLSASEISQLLREIGDHLAMKGGNPYRSRAYSRAADNLALSTIPLGQLIEEDRLTEIPGVGDALAAVITRLYKTGEHSSLEKMRTQTPRGVLEMLRLPGLRPDRIKKLYSDLGISSVKELEEAARDDRLKSTKGFGPAFQAKVLQAIDMSRRPQGRHLHRAASAFGYASAELERSYRGLTKVIPAGEFRRGCELIGTLVMVAVDPDLKGKNRTITAGDSLTVHITTKDRYGITLLFATGSAQHIKALRVVAASKGLSLDEDGVSKNNRIVASKTEEDIYDALGLPFIHPELRETGAEVQMALEHKLPELVTKADIRGVLHAHTRESDGADTLEDMAGATRDRGYAYLGVTDHSQTAHYAGGLKPHEVKAQQKRIEKLNNNNYTYWRSCMESYLQGQDLWETVAGANTSPPEDADALRKWKVCAAKALYVIKVTIETHLIEHIRDEKTTKQAWDTFASLFSRANDARLQVLENEIGTIAQGQMFISQISQLDKESAISDARMRRIII